MASSRLQNGTYEDLLRSTTPRLSNSRLWSYKTTICHASEPPIIIFAAYKRHQSTYNPRGTFSSTPPNFCISRMFSFFSIVALNSCSMISSDFYFYYVSLFFYFLRFRLNSLSILDLILPDSVSSSVRYFEGSLYYLVRGFYKLLCHCTPHLEISEWLLECFWLAVATLLRMVSLFWLDTR